MTIIQRPSPNYDSNRLPIKRVIVHWIVGNLASADAVFAKPNSVSTHYGIEDTTIHQYVPEDKVAYHVGVYTINQESIGIEHSAAPGRVASDLTYDTSGRLIAEICKRYNIPIDRKHIEPHNKYRATQCPGTMDLDRLITIAKSNNVQMVTIPQAELDEIRLNRDANWNIYTATMEEFQKCQESLNKCENKPPQIVTETKEIIVTKEIEVKVPAKDLSKLNLWEKFKILFKK